MKKSAAALGLSLLLFSCDHKDYIVPELDNTPISLNVNVKFQVGQYLYEDNEATIVAKGFDAANNEKWSGEFHFVGPMVNIIAIERGYDHYTISLEKWGVTDSQSLTGKQLWDDRADGELPVTYVLGGKAPVVKKPTVVYTYSDDSSLPISSRAEYIYDDNGRIDSIKAFDNYEASQVPSLYKVFTYTDGRLTTLTTYDASTKAKTMEDTYQYGVDNIVLRISEANYSAVLTATVDLTVDVATQKTNAVYQFSNGRGFQYGYTTSWKNLVSSNETNGGQLCNTGTFTYDRNINPFRHLNYTSFLVSENVSINNTLTEDVNFIGCAFPTLIPLAYEYKYDELGYPTEKVTHYKGKTATSITKYTYREFPQ